MALTECPECQHQVSTNATACPTCGNPMNQQDNSTQSTTVTGGGSPAKIIGFLLIVAGIITTAAAQSEGLITFGVIMSIVGFMVFVAGRFMD